MKPSDKTLACVEASAFAAKNPKRG